MSERLGEMLLHVGSLTEEQLEQALSAQSIYGGKIGTNLVEMGLLSENDLGRMLNEKLGVPCVDASSLAHLPASLIGILPQEMVQRFQVLPIALDGKRLTLAMTDPGNFNAIDEIGFYTGLVIVPRVCSELRLTMALEHYYGIKRVLHFIPVEGGSRTHFHNLAKDWMDAPETSLPPKAEPEKAHPDSDCLVPSPDSILHHTPGQNSRPSQKPSGSLGSSQSSEGKSDDCLGAELKPEPGPEPRSSELRANAGSSMDIADCNEGHGSMEMVAAKFASASGDAEVVAILMQYLLDHFARAGFLSLRRGSAVGVQAVAEGRTVPVFLGWVVDLEGAAPLKEVLEKRVPYLGKLGENGAEEQILAKIGGTAGEVGLLLPLVISGASVAFLLVADGKDRLIGGLVDLQHVVAKAALAFEMLNIRKKIALA